MKDIPLLESIETSAETDHSLSNIEYVSNMKISGRWGDGVIVMSAVRSYQRDFDIVILQGRTVVTVPLRYPGYRQEMKNVIHIGYLKDKQHYVYLEPKTSDGIQLESFMCKICHFSKIITL